MVSVTVSSAGKPPSVARKLPITVDLADKTVDTATIGDLKIAIARQFPSFYTSRQKLSLKGEKKGLSDDDTLKKLGVTSGGELIVKDLGPQIGWKTVFIIEYAGPLVIHPLFYYFPKIFYGVDVQHSLVQQYAFAMVLLHYFKREFETLFVHRFSHGTMPFRNIFKNSFHYHVLGGLLLASAIYRPKYSAVSPLIQGTKYENLSYIYIWAGLFAFAELSNLKTHLTLRSLRPAGTRQRAVPFGYGFNLVSCPNYFFESVAWLSVSMLTGSWASWFFYVVGTGQMIIWAIKKHKSYRKEFGSDYPRGRKIMFPFLY